MVAKVGRLLPMAINIKNPEAVEAIHDLAAHYHTDYGHAITMAATDVLSKAPDVDSVIKRVNEIAADYMAHAGSGVPLNVDDLYGEDGLPA